MRVSPRCLEIWVVERSTRQRRAHWTKPIPLPRRRHCDETKRLRSRNRYRDQMFFAGMHSRSASATLDSVTDRAAKRHQSTHIAGVSSVKTSVMRPSLDFLANSMCSGGPSWHQPPSRGRLPGLQINDPHPRHTIDTPATLHPLGSASSRRPSLQGVRSKALI
jgi:hypothetical protein